MPAYQSPHSTPLQYIFRIQSIRLPDDKSKLRVRPELYDHLKRDLTKRTVQKATLLIANRLAAAKIPQLSIELYRHLKDLKLLDQYLQVKVSLLRNEAVAAFYLNTLIAAIKEWYHVNDPTTNYETLRYFCPDRANKPLSGPISLKPDISLLPLTNGHTIDSEKLRWSDVIAVLELTATKSFSSKMRQGLSSKRFLVGIHQGDRFWIPCVSVHGQHFRLVGSDYEGDVMSVSHPFTAESGSGLFLRIIMMMAFSESDMLGLDKTMTRHPISETRLGAPLSDIYPPPSAYTEPYPWNSVQSLEGFIRKRHSRFNYPLTSDPPPTFDDIIDVDEVEGIEEDDVETILDTNKEADCPISSITCEGKAYPVEKEIFRAQALVGRGTRVYAVKVEGDKLAVVKESWINKSQSNEADFLKTYDKIPNTIRCISAETLMDTFLLRTDVPEPDGGWRTREKRRLLMKPFGLHISTVISPFELLIIIKDMVEAIKYLGDHGKVHRDISFNNILLCDFEEQVSSSDDYLSQAVVDFQMEFKCRRGLLIDFDYVGDVVAKPTGKRATSIGDQTGTAPFMAMRILQGYTEHTVAHDLESLFYVLLVICLSFDKLDGQVKGILDDEVKDNPTSCWFDVASFDRLEMIKSGQLHEFEDKLILHITRIFQPLYKFVLQLFNALFPHRKNWGFMTSNTFWISPVKPDHFSHILKMALEDNTVLAESEPFHDRENSRSKKRSRVSSDASLDPSPLNRSRGSNWSQGSRHSGAPGPMSIWTERTRSSGRG